MTHPWPVPPATVLITARNEGDHLRKTIDSVRLHSSEKVEIIVIDDASQDRSAAFLGEAPYASIRLVRNETRLGLIQSRALGADLARGDLLVFLDAHCAVTPGWIEDMARSLAGLNGRGLVVPVIYKLKPDDWSIDLDGPAAEACTITSPFLDFGWTAPTLMGGRPSTCTIGGGAWMTSREWYRHTGGLDRGMLIWGGENIDFPLRTWTAGGACLVAGGVRIGHLFNENPIAILPDFEFVYNKIRAVHNAFTSETFHRVMSSLRYLDGFRDAMRKVHEEKDELGRWKAFIEERRKRPDSWIIDAFRLPLREPAFFYLAPRRAPRDGGEQPRRPAVTIISQARRRDDGGLIPAVLETTTYGNCELFIISKPENAAPRDQRAGGAEDPGRVRTIVSSAPLEGGRAENLGAAASGSEYIVFLPEGAVILDESWLERFLLVAEKRPRILMAFPRTALLPTSPPAPPEGAGRGSPEEAEDLLDATWDWEAPGFLRTARGKPPCEGPYQAFSPPETALFVHRERFLELGGFDDTVKLGGPSVLDLALRGWLAGYEIVCHPGIRFGLRTGDGADGGSDDPRRDFGRLLPAAKCFSSPERISRCLERLPRAEPLLRRHSAEIGKRRLEVISRSRFDEEWLFYKFGVPLES